MANKQRVCPVCGTKIQDTNADKCPHCGEGLKQSLYICAWFWVMIGVIVVVLVGAIVVQEITVYHGAQETDEDVLTPPTEHPHGAQETDEDVLSEESVSYSAVDLQTLFRELDENANRAKECYQNQYVQFEGKIVILDGDGAYVRVKAANADAWNAPTVLCYVTDWEQRAFLELASKGDRVTVRGRITGVGQARGYTLKICEIE